MLKALHDEFSARLEHIFATTQPHAAAPGLQLTPAETDQIAQALGLGAAVTARAILAGIERLAAIRIGDIRIPFTPGQLAELQHRAGKRGRTLDAELRAVVARVEEELFHHGG